MATSGNKSVLFLVTDSTACGWYRAMVPGVELKSRGYDVVMSPEIKAGDYERFDVFVFQRVFCERTRAAIDYAKSIGKLTVYDLDDDVWRISPTNPAYSDWEEQDAAASVAQAIRKVDLVTTPTSELAEVLKRFNPNVKVIPNMLPSTGWDHPPPTLKSNDRVVLGWAGGSSHVEDLNILVDVVTQLLARYPFVEFAFAGGPPVLPFGADERISQLESTDIENYPTLLERFDIGLIPLVDTTFNRAKSDLKFIEYSMVGIPSVVSKLEPYLRSVKHGENGFLASNAKDWLKSLIRLIESPELRLEVADRAQEFARARTIDKGIEKWIRAYGLTSPSAVD